MLVGNVTDTNEAQLVNAEIAVVTAFIAAGNVTVLIDEHPLNRLPIELHAFKLVGKTTVVNLKQLINALAIVVQLFCAEFIVTDVNEVHVAKVVSSEVITYVVGIVIDVNEMHPPNAEAISIPPDAMDDGNVNTCNCLQLLKAVLKLVQFGIAD
jgi:hypothetical protein